MVKQWRPVRERSTVNRMEVREATGEQLLLWQSPKHSNVGPRLSGWRTRCLGGGELGKRNNIDAGAIEVREAGGFGEFCLGDATFCIYQKMHHADALLFALACRHGVELGADLQFVVIRQFWNRQSHHGWVGEFILVG
jgi:hypothetical protein